MCCFRREHIISGGNQGKFVFRGGRIESSDRNEEAAAVRETCEELGLSPGELECFGPLDYLIEPHRVVYPFIGQILQPERIRPNEEEVSRLFYIPLEELKTFKPEVHSVDVLYRPKDGFPFELILNDQGTMWKRGEHDMYFYNFEEFTVWGLTALILHHFLGLMS